MKRIENNTINQNKNHKRGGKTKKKTGKPLKNVTKQKKQNAVFLSKRIIDL